MRMRTSYVIAHVLVQSSLMVLALYFLPLFGFLVTGTVWSSVGLLAALTAARAVSFVLGILLGIRGYVWDGVSMLLVATLTVLVLWISGMGDFDATSWIVVFCMLLFTYVFAHLVLRAAGARTTTVVDAK